MKVTVLAGGYGGAKFLAGLRALPDTDITAVVNTADDIVLHGLTICPDLDTVMYALGDGLDPVRGWGRRDEAFRANEELAAYGMANTWFGLGDRDIATHLVRSQMLAAGYRLTDVTAALAVRWDPGVRILPMSDDRVETHVVVGDAAGRKAIHFQEWWIKGGAAQPAESFVQVGADTASPTAEVLAALGDADVIILAPSNPVVSVGAILSVPGIAEAVRTSPAPVVGVSPVIAGKALRGMAEQCLAALAVPPTAAGIALHYGSRSEGGLIDGWLVAEEDRGDIIELAAAGIVTEAVPLLMTDESTAAALASAAVGLAQRSRS